MQQTPAAIAWKRRENEFVEEKSRLLKRISRLEDELAKQENDLKLVCLAIHIICVNPQNDKALQQFYSLVKADQKLNILLGGSIE